MAINVGTEWLILDVGNLVEGEKGRLFIVYYIYYVQGNNKLPNNWLAPLQVIHSN